MRKPSRFAVRECVDKRCFAFKTTGYYREIEVSEEHPMIVLDGIKYRHKKKLASNAAYRRKKGIAEGGDKPCIRYEDNLICRKEAQDVDIQDYLLCPLPNIGNESISPNKSWMIGVCIADGYITSNESKSRIVGITLNSEEYEFAKNINDAMSSFHVGKISNKPHGYGKGFRISVGTKEAHGFFRSYITGKKTAKKFTSKVFELDKESRLHILGGYFDGDGSYNPKSKKLIANNYSKDMADQLYFMLLSVGISCSLNRVPLYGDHYETDSEWCYRIIVPSSEVPKLQSYMRSDKIPDDFEPKKTREIRFIYEDEDGTEFLAQPIEYKKEFLYTGPGYDIQVDPDRAFVASGYVTSNCRFYYENEPKVAAGIDFYCFTPSTPILMHTGKRKPISSVRTGDLVRCSNGSVNKVVRKFERQAIEEELYNIYVAGLLNGPITSSSTHKFLVKRGEKAEYVIASELKNEDYLLTPACYYGDINDKNTINKNDLGYLLGAYAAEGCETPYEHVSQRGRKTIDKKGVKFYLNISEEKTFGKAILDCVKRLYGDNKISIDKIFDTSTLVIKVYGKDIADDLCGMCPGTSSDGNKRLAPHVFNNSSSFLFSFLAGFFDGDGSWSQNMGQQSVGVCYELFSQIQDICAGLGLEYAYEKRRPSNMGRQTVHVVRLPRRSMQLFKGIAVKTGEWEEPQSRFQNHITFERWGNYISRKIRKIKTINYTGPMLDMEVENHHSYVANGISCSNSQFPINGFKIECKKKKIAAFYERVADRLELLKWLRLISHERFLLGDVFVFLEIDSPDTRGETEIEPGESPTHADGTFRRIMVLNPDWVEVYTTPMADEPEIVMLPDDELKKIVMTKQPESIYKRLPENIKQLVAAGQPIRLSNKVTSHIKHGGSPYGTYGDSLLRRLFTILAYKTKLMTANWIVAERLILPVRVVKVGEKDRPAAEDDIADVVQQLSAVANDPNLTIVTHHAFDYIWYGATGKIHNITSEIEQIGKEMLDGLMLNQALLNGEAGGYQNAQVGVEMLIRRLESWRNELAKWVEKNIFLPIAKMQGFIDEEESEVAGETVYLYPKIKWDDLKLRDPTNRMQMAMNLHQNGTISTQTLLEMFELDYDQEIERIRDEQVQTMGNGQVMAGGMPGGGMPGGGMPGGDPMGGGMPGGAPMGGGMPGGDPMGGGMPGADPMGGGMPGGAPMGGGMPGGGMPAGAESQPPQKVTKKGKGKSNKEAEEQVPQMQVQNIQLTKPEAKVYRILSQMNLPFQLYAQYKYQVPGEQQPYLLDFALPDIGLNVEADGEKWHSTFEDKSSDQKRDYKLAEKGWTVIRISETALNENVEGVEHLLAENIKLAVEQRRKMNSKSSNNKLTGYKFVEAETNMFKCTLIKSTPKYNETD